MKTASNVTEKTLSAVFSKSVVEKALMLECKCLIYRTELNEKAGSYWIEFWRSWSETNQRIELKEEMRKMGSFV